LKITNTHTGYKSALYKGRILHSNYNPVKEAERFVRRSLTSPFPSIIVLMGAGLGYISKIIKQLYPYTKLLCIYYAKEIFDQSSFKGDIFWHPHSKYDLTNFLRKNIHEIETEGLQFLEWPPCADIFQNISWTAHLSLKQVLKELAGGLFTTVASGKLWIRNSLFNFLSINTPLQGNPCRKKLPVLIAASGPWLAQAIPLIKRFRQKLNLWALPSALLCLAENHIIPDLVVMTDPRYYAAYHLHFAKVYNPIIAMPLSAALGIWRIKARVYLFAQPNFFEQSFLSYAQIQIPNIPLNGTVAGTALDLALSFSQKPIIIAGLDFCFKDIISHVQPNAFCSLLYYTSKRLTPHYHLSFIRAQAFAPHRDIGNRIRTSPPHQTYLGWFSNLGDIVKKRIFRLCPSPIPIPGIKDLNKHSFKELLINVPLVEAKQTLSPIACYPPFAQRINIAQKTLTQWITYIEQAMKNLKTKNKLSILIDDQLLFNLSFFTDPVSLIEIRKKARLQGEKAALKIAFPMLQGEYRFFKNLLNKIQAIHK